MTRTRLTVVVGVAVIVVLIAGALVGYHLHDESDARNARNAEQPPPLTAAAHAQGVERLTYPDAAKRLPPRPLLLEHGNETVAVYFDGASEVDGQAAAQLRIVAGPTGSGGANSPVVSGALPAGRSLSDGDVTVKVVAVWAMYNYAHDAADVLVTYS